MPDKTSAPLISVIVPVYNVEQCLERCLDSIIGQDFKDMEILLVNDGSTDASGEICRRYAEKDPRVRVFHQENRGLSDARNRGLSEARGAFTGFVDSDDSILPDMYSSLYECIREYDADIASCGFYRVNMQDTRRDEFRPDSLTVYDDPDEALRELILDKVRLNNYAWNKLYRSELFSDIRFPSGKNYEDIRIMYSVFEKTRRIVCLDRSLYEYRMREDSIQGEYPITTNIGFMEGHQDRFREFAARRPEFTEPLLRQYMCQRVYLYNKFFLMEWEEAEKYLPVIRDLLEPFDSEFSEELSAADRDGTAVSRFILDHTRACWELEHKRLLTDRQNRIDRWNRFKAAERKLEKADEALRTAKAALETAEKKRTAAEAALETAEKKRTAAEEESASLRKEIKDIRESSSFRLGRTVTYLPRQLRRLIRGC